MKKRLILGILAIALCTAMVVSTGAQTMWTNTKAVVLAHGYSDGGAACLLTIQAKTGATVTNVDIRLDQIGGTIPVNIASWDDLYSGNLFVFSDFVSDVEPYNYYRLSFTAEVWLNGTVEYLNLYKDVYYTEDTRSSSSWIQTN